MAWWGVRPSPTLSMSITSIEELKKLTETELRDYVAENQSDTFAYGELPIVEIDGVDYAIAFNEWEADQAATEYIQETVWAFNPDFIANMTSLPVEIFQCVANSGMCVSSNDAILACINQTCGINEFALEAISCDGRGHFLNMWDGEEIELESGGYAYQV